MSKPVLEIKDFNVDFWVDGVWYPAVIDMNLGLAAGKVTAIVGESGSGKSTTALGLMSLLASNARMQGSIKVKGEEMLNAKSSVLRQFRGKEVAYIFQEPMTALNPLFTIGYQIVETLRNHFEMGPKEAHARALELITMVDIPNPEQSILKYPHQLSGGQRQRAMIAQALACDPALLVADEPTTALDVTVQAEILDLMRDLKDKLNSAILLITHDMGVVADMADEILVMKDGITVEHGTADQIFNKPQHPYTQQLLGAVPKLGSSKKRALPYKEDAKPAPVLKLTDVTIEYPKRGRIPAFTAVKNFNLEIYPGEIVGLVGESGSGKSVTSLAVMGLHNRKIAQISGQAFLNLENGPVDVISADEEVVRKLRGKAMSMIFQDPMSALHPYYSIGNQLIEAWSLYNEGSKEDGRKRAIEMLDLVGIPAADKRVDEYPHQFSGGMRQRVMIAMALINNPSLLIADEPTTALDVTVQSQILQLIRDMQKEFNMALILITHDLGVVAEVADRVNVMYAGKIVESGGAEDIYYRPDHPYAIGLLNSIPKIGELDSKRLVAIPGQPPSLINLPQGCSFRARCEFADRVPGNLCATTTPTLDQKGADHFSRCHLPESELVKARTEIGGRA